MKDLTDMKRVNNYNVRKTTLNVIYSRQGNGNLILIQIHAC